MKHEMRSVLANNKTNSSSNKNFQQQQATHKTPDVRLIPPTPFKYSLPTTTTTTTSTKLPSTMTATKYNHATNIPLPITSKITDPTKTTITTRTTPITSRTYLPIINNNVNNPTTITTTTSNDRSMSLDTSLILPERTRLRRQRRMLSQNSVTEQIEDPVERLNRLRARISGALNQVKGVLKQYSSTDVELNTNADGNDEENINSKNSDAFRKDNSSNNNSSRNSSNNNSNRPSSLLKNFEKKYEKKEEISRNFNETPNQNLEKEQIEMEQQIEEEDEEGPVNFRFVRKVRRRSIFIENDEIQITNAQKLDAQDEKEQMKSEQLENNYDNNNNEKLTTISNNLDKEHNEEKHNENNENDTKCNNSVDGERNEEKNKLEINESIVKKPSKKRIVIIKKSKGTLAARRASIAAVECSKIEPTVKKLVPLHIKAQRRPSDSETIVNKKILLCHNKNSLTETQLNAIDDDVGIYENGSMEEEKNNTKLILKVNNETNATPSVLHRKTYENVANDIGINNNYTGNNNNINNNNNNNNIITYSVDENENSNKDNNKIIKTTETTTNDIELMPVNCSTPTPIPIPVDETSITIVTLIDDAEKLLGVTAGDNVNLSMNNKDSTTNQINTREQLVENITRTTTKLDDKQSTAMVAMLMLSPLQDVVTSGDKYKTIQNIRTTIDGEFNNNQEIISEFHETEHKIDQVIKSDEKEEANKLQVHAIEQTNKVFEKQEEILLEKEEKEKKIKETESGDSNFKLQDQSSSSKLLIAATATFSEVTSTQNINNNMPELQAVPVPVQLSEHNDKLKNAEPPFNNITKDNYGKKHAVHKKFIRKNSLDKTTVLKKINKIQTILEPKVEPSTIIELPLVEIDNEAQAKAEETVAEIAETVEDDKIVKIKPPRKIKKKVIIKRQQRRLSVSDTGFFREPVSDEQTDGTASDIEILEKPISYVTDDEDYDDDNNKADNVHDVKKIRENYGLPEDSEEFVPLKSCMKAREFQVDDWVMYAERFKKTMVRWKKGRVIERITSISYKLDIDGKEVPAHISYIKKYTDRKVNFGDKEYLEINYEQIEQENNITRSYSIWNMV